MGIELVHEGAAQTLSVATVEDSAGHLLAARATVVHHGRRLAVVDVEISESDNRPAVLGNASVILLPGIRWNELARLTGEPHELIAQGRD